VIAAGEYRLDRMLDISTPSLVLRGADHDFSKTILRGAGMTEQAVGVAISVSAPQVTIADMTIGYVGFHGIQVRGERGASQVMIHNVHIVDTGQQLIKGSTDGGPMHADEGVVACSTLEYSDHAPSDYTNGVDVLGGNGWSVHDNTLRRIRGPADRRFASGPAILFWANSQDTRIERNTIIDSFRGIAFGLGPGASRALARNGEARFDHQGGSIRNNVVVNMHDWADEGIELNAARGATVDHNTVVTLGLPWSISVRFAGATAQVRNNLTSRQVILRDGGEATQRGNVAGASPAWFVDAERADLRLSRDGRAARRTGVMLPDVKDDRVGRSRPAGTPPDAGAFQSPETD